MSMTDTVVILHGIFRTSFHMRKLAAYLAKQGYNVINLDYPSTRYTLEKLVPRIWNELAPRLPAGQPVHFVGYSMGGLLVRAILAKHRPQSLGRVVLLATPNHGSEVADALKRWGLYRRLYGPAGQQLGTDSTAIAHLFGNVDYELGILAGNLCHDPLCALFLKGEHDGKVTVASTRLDGMAAHAVVHATHMGFPHHPEVQRRTAHFLKHGTFG